MKCKGMTEELEVNDPSQGADSSTAEEQADIVSEDVQNSEADVREAYEQEKANLRNIREAIRREKEKLEALQQAPEPTFTPQVEDDVQQRFINTEAKATIAYLAQTEPAFKEIAPLVLRKIEQGMPVEQAIKDVKALLFDRISTEASKAEEVLIQPNQLKPTADPEPVKVKFSGNIIRDASKGKYDNVPPELQNTLKRMASELG